jgi:hypothetical protein
MTVRWSYLLTVAVAARANSTCGANRHTPSTATIMALAPSVATATNGTANSITAMAKNDTNVAVDSRRVSAGCRTGAGLLMLNEEAHL